MKLHAIGLDVRHTGDFCIDRPNGSGDDLLIIFKTNALVTINGEEISAPPVSAILYSAGEKQLYRTAGEIYINHFMHFEGLEEDGFDYEPPVNRLIYLGGTDDAEEILGMISREQVSGSENKERYIDMLIKILIMKLSDAAHDKSPLSKNPHSAEFNSLRAEIYSNPGQFSSIAQLAEKLSFSPSHFQQLYKTQFGISCYEDLLTAKIRTAKYYLRNTELSIKEISVLCGYGNEICFMRRFKKRTGLTPTEYRERQH